MFCGQSAKHKVRIGHRNLGATPAISDGARLRTGAAWTNPQRTTFVGGGNRTAPGSDRMNINCRYPNGNVTDGGLGRSAHMPWTEANIRTSATHVKGDYVFESTT